jgi:hypothetical protein
MAFDLDGYLNDAKERQEQREAAAAERAAQEANQAAWDAKPWYERLAEGTMADAAGAWVNEAGEAWSDLGNTVISAGTHLIDAHRRFADAQLASRDKDGNFTYTQEVQDASRNLWDTGADFVMDPVKVAASHATQLPRNYIGAKINQNADEGSEFAQDLRSTETFVNYFMTDEDKLRKAREIEANTGISANAFMDDDVAFKQALRINDYANMKKNLMQGDFSMEAVWQEFPELRDVAKMSSRDAALALHDIESVRQTHGIVETFTHFLAVGNKKLEYDNLQYKIMIGTADENDRQRAADLAQMMEEDKKEKPSFFDDPLAAIVGGMASSGPEMLESIRIGVRDGLITAEAAAAMGAALGTGIEPGGGTLLGGAVGAAGGFAAGTVRSVITRASQRQLVKSGMSAGMRVGMFEGMRRPETGARYAEYGEMKDKDGNPLLTDNDRWLYAALGGAANAGIEMANFGIATKPLVRGVNALGKGGYAETAIKGVVDAAKYDVAKRESISAFAKSQVKDTLKIAATESLEEGAQSLSDDLIHNHIVNASDGRAADKVYSLGDMAANALVSSVEAFPAGLGFGVMSTMGGASIGSVRHAQRLSSEKMQEQLAAQKTMTGTVMLDRLQQVASSAKLKQTAPDVQQKIIRTQVHGTGFENAYIDTEMAMKKENGLADLKEVAKTAGIREEELEKTIQSGGHLFVPAERYAQSAASPQLLESVSFTPETDSIARMKENTKALSDALEGAQKSAIKARTEIINSIASEYFPKPADHLDAQEKARMDGEREMATAVISQNPDNPAAGWRSLYNEFTVARDEILKPAMEALSRGMKQGVDILPIGEDGRGIRVSNNAPWYQAYYKENGKAPNKAQLRDLAYLLTVGDASAPEVEGWIPTTREAAEAMDGARGELDELNGYIKTLENIKDRMMKVDSFEVKGSAGLSPEAYSVYRQIVELLENVGVKQKEDKQTKVARMNALLFAHHADIFAAAMRTQKGKEKYTALDYFKNRFAMRYGGKDMRSNDVLHQAVRTGLNLDEQIQVVDLDTMTNDLKGKSDQEIIDYISKTSALPPVPTADFQALVGLPKDSDSYGQRHLVRGNANKSSDNRTARNIMLSNFEDIAKNAVVVEVVPNTKQAPLTGLKGKKRQAQKRKNQVSNYYRLMVPVRIGDRIKTLVVVAEEHDGVVSTGSVPVTAYEIYYAKKPPLAATPRPKTGVSAAEEEAPLTVSIRDMLTGVKDADGNVYAQSAWHGTGAYFSQFLLSLIGTGEGNQAHGWGLYFAEDRDTAEEYRYKLSSGGDVLIYYGETYEHINHVWMLVGDSNDAGGYIENDTGEAKALDEFYSFGNAEEAIASLQGELDEMREGLSDEELEDLEEDEEYQKIQEAIEILQSGNIEEGSSGSLFEVEIPDSDVLLNEDAYYDAQPEKVQRALDRLAEDLKNGTLPTIKVRDYYGDLVEYKREDKDEQFAEEYKGMAGDEIYEYLSDDPEYASRLLNEYGIKGITYYGQSDGRCFVVFDEDAIEILDRYDQMLRQEVKGEISQEDGKRIITLFESADESTFMHEMGHMFLMDLDELAQIDEASAKDLEAVNAWAEWHEGAADEYAETDFADEFRDHENAILAAKKAGDTVAEKAAMERWRQERFARGFEMYLAEGKAPSAAVRSVFRRFKAFLRTIYNLAKNVGAMPSAEVQAVMARMIATEEEIKAAQLDERFRPMEKLLGKESIESLLGETEAELYQRWTQEAQEEAEDILRKRVMKDLEKEAREEFNQKVEAERERKRIELENDPVYLAEYAMREGGDTDVVMNWFPSYAAYKKARAGRKTLEEELQAHVDEYARNLDEQIMQAHLSDENVARAMQTPKAYHRRLAIESAALRRKERLMRVLGGNAPEEVKKKAAEDAERKESDTRRGTKEQTRKEYERSAYAYEKFLREQARMYLRERTISESCNPRFFRRKERQYARALNKAATAGKWSEVLELKEQQAFAAACAYAAEENEKRLNQLLANVKRKLSARTVRLAADERYWLNHIGYLLGLKANDAEKPVDCTKLSDLFAQYKDNNDIDACDPSDLLDLITEEKKKYKDMQLDDFADIVNAMNVLYSVGRNRNEMLTKSMQGKTKDDILTEIFTDDTALKPSGVVEHPVSDDVGGMGYSELLARIPLLGEVVAKAAQEGNIELTKPELILRLMGDKAHRYIYGTYERAQMKESELLEEKRAALEKIFSVYSKSEKMKWSKKNINAYGDMLSKEEVFCLAFNWGTETNRKRVMDDIGQRLDVMRTLKENMTEKDWKVVQEVWNLLDTFWEESARVEERLNGAHIGKVPASAFTIETADGKEITLQGGYYPLRYNPKKASKVNDKQTEEDVKGRMTGAQVFGTKRGHVKERSKGDVIAPVLLQFDVLKDHIFNASHNIAFRIAARDVYRIINDKEFEAYVSSTYGRPIYNYLKQWAVDVWAVPVEASDSAAMGINRIIGGLRRNSTMAIMGWRLWPCLENTLTNTLLNMDKIGIRKTAEAYFEGLPIFGKGPKALRDMAKKSAFMADRISNMERDIRRDPHIFDPTYAPLEFLRDNAYYGISFTDQMFSVPLWNKVYKEAFPKALAQINEENEANKRTYKEAQDRVYALRAEIYDLRREMEELVDPSLQKRIREKEKEFAQAGIALERAGELPVYDERERIQEAETRAVQAGDAAVRDTFGSGQTKDLSGAQRTRSELFKLFTSFFSFFNTQYNAALEAHYRGKYSKTGYKHIHVWMPLARAILFRIVLVGVLGGLGKAALGLEGDDDKDKYRKVKDPKTGETIKVEIPWEDRWMKIVLKNTLSTATGMFPGVRDFAGFALDQIFDGTTYGRTFEFGALASRGGKQALATWNLIMKKGEDDLKREEEEEKERARVKKMTKQQRKRYEEDKKYRKPKKEIGYLDIAKSAAQTVSTLTATRHGVTNTVSDGLFSIALYVEDMMETDNYYDPDIRNVLRAVLFDKKLRPREMPEKPKKPKKKSRTRGAR